MDDGAELLDERSADSERCKLFTRIARPTE
jgi:hypothetical protein